MNAQTIKTYTGNNGVGTVTYTYYFDENNKETKHGDYKYVEKYSQTNPVGNYIKTIVGTFKNGKKNGIWTNSKTAKDYGDSNNNYSTYTIIQKYNYKDGVPDGQWTKTQTGNFRTKLYNTNGWYWGQFEPLSGNGTSIINWKDGVLIDNFRIRNISNDISGHFNNGVLVGLWKTDGNEYQYTNNGILKEMINRNNFGGVSRKSYDKEISVYNEYIALPQERKETFKFDKRLKIDTVNAGLINKSIKTIFFDFDMFMHPRYDDYNDCDELETYGNAKYIEISFIKQKYTKEFLGGEPITTIYNTNRLYRILEDNKFEISKETADTIQNRIEELEFTSELIKEINSYEKAIEYYFILNDFLDEEFKHLGIEAIERIKWGIKNHILNFVFIKTKCIISQNQKISDYYDYYNVIKTYNKIKDDEQYKNCFSKIDIEIIEDRIKELGIH